MPQFQRVSRFLAWFRKVFHLPANVDTIHGSANGTGRDHSAKKPVWEYLATAIPEIFLRSIPSVALIKTPVRSPPAAKELTASGAVNPAKQRCDHRERSAPPRAGKVAIHETSSGADGACAAETPCARGHFRFPQSRATSPGPSLCRLRARRQAKLRTTANASR
jgi:hypothetical protein